MQEEEKGAPDDTMAESGHEQLGKARCDQGAVVEHKGVAPLQVVLRIQSM